MVWIKIHDVPTQKHHQLKRYKQISMFRVKVLDHQGKRHISILSMRNVIWTFFWRPTTPTPLRNVTHFFRLYEAHEALLILQAIRLSVVYKRIKVHLGQGQNLIVSIQIYLKYKYTYENAGFCVRCIDDFKISKKFYKLSKFFTFFTEKRHSRHPPPPTPPTP